MGPGSSRDVTVSMAIGDYDHVRDLTGGRVRAQGVDLVWLELPVEETFYRFTRFREWDVSELSLAKYCALRSRGDDSLVGIPVFPSRVFRHSALFVRADGPVDDPAALRGARIGVPEWTVTATVYGRGLLEHEFGVGLRDVTWVQGGTNEPGRIETLPVEVPTGVVIERCADTSLNDLLLAGRIDAVLAPHPPAASADGSGRVVPLFSDARAVEESSYANTGIYPIMHLVVLRAEVHRAHPWIAGNLMTAFGEARDRSLARLADHNISRLPVPWGPAHAASMTRLLGGDPFPYGVEANRTTLEAFLGYAHEQGVCASQLTPEDLFDEQVRTSFRI